MRAYETIFIVDPDVSDEDIDKIMEKLVGVSLILEGGLSKLRSGVQESSLIP